MAGKDHNEDVTRDKPSLFSLGGSDPASLFERIKALEAENWNLRMSIALLTHKSKSKPRGRPRKAQSDLELLRAVDFVMARDGTKTVAAALRMVNSNMPAARRLSRVKLQQEIKTIQNVVARARRASKEKDE